MGNNIIHTTHPTAVLMKEFYSKSGHYDKYPKNSFICGDCDELTYNPTFIYEPNCETLWDPTCNLCFETDYKPRITSKSPRKMYMKKKLYLNSTHI